MLASRLFRSMKPQRSTQHRLHPLVTPTRRWLVWWLLAWDILVGVANGHQTRMPACLAGEGHRPLTRAPVVQRVAEVERVLLISRAHILALVFVRVVSFVASFANRWVEDGDCLLLASEAIKGVCTQPIHFHG
jgi:hypothetical protein